MATEKGMIEPFVETQTKARNDGSRVISYGLSSYGYDLRVSREFKVFTNVFNTVVDPKVLRRAVDGRYGDRCLHRSAEFFCVGPQRRVLPNSSQRTDHLRGEIHLRSLRYYRQCHAIRAGVGGPRHLEISNTTPLPAKIYADEGLAQVVFFLAGEICETSYADRAGKYMRQTGITIPRM